MSCVVCTQYQVSMWSTFDDGTWPWRTFLQPSRDHLGALQTTKWSCQKLHRWIGRVLYQPRFGCDLLVTTFVLVSSAASAVVLHEASVQVACPSSTLKASLSSNTTRTMDFGRKEKKGHHRDSNSRSVDRTGRSLGSFCFVLKSTCCSA